MFFSKKIKDLFDLFGKQASQIEKIEKKQQELEILYASILEEKKNLEIMKDAATGIPWLAKMHADFYYLRDIDMANYLQNKKHPAISASDNIKSIAKEKRELVCRLKEAEYNICNFTQLFPEAENYIENVHYYDDDVKTEEQEQDEVLFFLDKEEYLKKNISERNQIALDRYKRSRNHSSWGIGKIYERYLGYSYEQKGYKVSYTGIKEGKNDKGVDLICSKENEILIIQCKCWSQKKQIRENSICQLYGSYRYYKHRYNEIYSDLLIKRDVMPVFISTTEMSDTAKEISEILNIKFIQTQLNLEYPIIKCNISADGSKIYHLPFDLQYDSTIIDKKGEFYAMTVKDAEAKGFRRAKRWDNTK